MSDKSDKSAGMQKLLSTRLLHAWLAENRENNNGSYTK
jgi:hypothetical protein